MKCVAICIGLLALASGAPESERVNRGIISRVVDSLLGEATTAKTTPKPRASTTAVSTAKIVTSKATTAGFKPTVAKENSDDECLLVNCAERLKKYSFKSEVCGTDLKTYLNINILRCQKQKCYSNLDFLKWGPCVAEVRSTTPKVPEPKQVVRPSDPPSDDEDTPVADADQIDYFECWDQCPRASNYQPVCGSDGNTYENDGYLKCAGQCGKPVSLSKQGKC